jgi:hypothetical protein
LPRCDDDPEIFQVCDFEPWQVIDFERIAIDRGIGFRIDDCGGCECFDNVGE